ncbi:phage tail sheath subtilisin-like domain-containing protein [Bosea sp. (in: a-proteobacteria)]|uniref:phage tail sheath subtilisin-like domain-containing protein n=1 Tax=Bosea sp. (in: a-proteobacteria) TaxID=1871050 RepID=UPI002734C4DC|nr:phage tail sheath subtilisin-like domain-containing protein [Bosea sp. (in: a-proteobacteria)]MDP3408191.1 phage tail sheath subtilisin-like domain-containing protein [Bosea sp. (in: a-proteobacteria)]
MINFDQIPYDWRTPGTYVEVHPNYRRRGLIPFPAKAIIITQKLASGTAIVGQKYEITRPEDATVLFGAGSVGQQMVRAWKKANKTNQVFALALADDGAGVKATKTLTFTGAGGGTIPIYVKNRRVRYKATASMTPTQHAAAAIAAINADADMPVVATAAVGVVTLTAKHAGEVGNHIDVRTAKTPEDVLPGTLAIAIADGTAGTGNPDLQDALDAIVNDWFTDFVVAWDDAANLELLQDELATRFTAMGKKDGRAFVGSRGTYGQLTTKGGLTNSPLISIIGAKRAYDAPWEWAAKAGGVAMFHLTNDPARQLRSLELPGLTAPDEVDCFDETERDLLLRAGISTWLRLDDGTVVLERVITTYKQTSLGVLDDAWLDITIPATMSRIRYDWAAYVTQVYPRHKLADDDSVAANNNDAVATPRRMHGSWGARCKLYERQAWIEKASETVARSVFERDVSNRNRMNSQQPVIVIGNLMNLMSRLEFEV